MGALSIKYSMKGLTPIQATIVKDIKNKVCSRFSYTMPKLVKSAMVHRAKVLNLIISKFRNHKLLDMQQNPVGRWKGFLFE